MEGRFCSSWPSATSPHTEILMGVGPSKPTLETLKSHIKISLIDQFDLNIAEGSEAQARWKSLTQA